MNAHTIIDRFGEEYEVAWRPQAGPQHALLTCPLPEIFFGGARGGGKTDGVLGKYGVKAQRYREGFNALFLRKELPMLDDAIERSRNIYGPIGATFNEQKKQWRFPSGGRLRFRPLERIADADKYQGQNVSDACVEEAGLYPDPGPIDRLNGVLRSASGVPTQLILTGNPGGAGQSWINKRYVEPHPAGMKPIIRELGNGRSHVAIYIPSRIENNRILLDHDPDYINRLYLVGSEALVKAWLLGDWNAIEGAFFPWRPDRHVIEPFYIPDDWLRFASFDWGSASPFAWGWFTVVPRDLRGINGEFIPRGALVKYREWYGATPNASGVYTGLKMENGDVARGVLTREGAEFDARGFMLKKPAERITYRVADPSIFNESGGPSIAEQMARQGVHMRPADNTRVPGLGHISGWSNMISRLVGDGEDPMLYYFKSCRHSIRTIPVLQHDPDKPEDLDTKAEDHIADADRYACSSRPWVPASAPKPKRDTGYRSSGSKSFPGTSIKGG